MNRDRILEWIARIIALAIVLAGIIDPEISLSRQIKPVVELHSADSAANATLIQRIREKLEPVGVAVWGTTPGSSAKLFIGSALPNDISDMNNIGDQQADNTPVFVVATALENGFHVEDIVLPNTAPLDSRTPVKLLVSRDAGSGNSSENGSGNSSGNGSGNAGGAAATKAKLTLELREEAVLLADTIVELSRGERTAVDLAYVPTGAGLHRLEVSAFPTAVGSKVERAKGTSRWERFVYAKQETWNVLFFDARPSWLSTFVRRALARDDRFKVSSRILTSTGVSLATPRAVADLTDLERQSELPDLLVIGAPEGLSAANRAALLSLVSDRGVQVMLLPDHAVSSAGASASGLPGLGGWRSVASRPPESPYGITWASIGGGDSLRLYTATPSVPDVLSPDALGLAFMAGRGAANGGPATRPVIWIQPLGRGEVLVSAVFDAWRYRDRGPAAGGLAGNTQSYTDFETSWQDLAAQMVQRRHRDLSITPAAVQQWTTIPDAKRGEVVLKSYNQGQKQPVNEIEEPFGVSNDISQLKISLSASHSLSNTVGAPQLLPTLLRSAHKAVWPVQDGLPSSEFAAVSVIYGNDTLKAPLSAGIGITDTPVEQLLHWTQSAGGSMVTDGTSGSLDSLAKAITEATPLPTQPYPWYPLRSPWWIVPLTAALATEWWLRRRRGLS